MPVSKLGFSFSIQSESQGGYVPGESYPGVLVVPGLFYWDGSAYVRDFDRFTLDGTWIDQLQLAEPTQELPFRIVGRGDGSYIELFGAADGDLTLRLRDADGGVLSESFDFPGYVRAGHGYADIEVAPNGAFSVIVNNGLSGGPHDDMQLFRFDKAGRQKGDALTIDLGNPNHDWTGGIGAQADGTLIVAHSQNYLVHTASGGSTLHSHGVAIEMIDGNSITRHIDLHVPRFVVKGQANTIADNAVEGAEPQAVVLDTGGFAIVYHISKGAFGPRTPTKFIAFFDENGDQTGTPKALFTDGGEQFTNNILFQAEPLEGGRVAIAWVEERGDKPALLKVGIASQAPDGSVSFESSAIARVAQSSATSGLEDTIVASDGSILVTYKGESDGPGVYTTQRLAVHDSGDMVLTGSGKGERIGGGAGDDWIDAEGGRDRAYGRNGNDSIDGGTGDDRLFGGNGSDHLGGGLGSDTLNGGIGADILNGGLDDDLLIGGGGGDTFVFASNWGTDRIRDFDALSSAEKLDFSQISTIRGFRDLVDNHMEQKNDNVIISDGLGNRVILQKIDIADLGAADFLF